MDRRTFSKKAVGALVGASVITTAARAEKISGGIKSTEPFKCKFAANIYKWTNICPNYTKGLSDVDKVKFWYDCGFRAMEDNDMMKYAPEKRKALSEQIRKLGMDFGVFTSSIGGGLWLTACKSDKRGAKPDKQAAIERIKAEAKKTVEIGREIGAKWTTVVIGKTDLSLEHSYQMANVVEQLKYAAEICEKSGLIMVLEPLSFTAHPGLWLQKTSDAYMICKAVGSPSCKILFDVFHQQNTEGSLIRNIDAAWDEIAYYHLGDVPKRTEPGSGEINFKNLIKHIHDKGYRGIYGMEHLQSDKSPAGDAKLINYYRQIDHYVNG